MGTSLHFGNKHLQAHKLIQIVSDDITGMVLHFDRICLLSHSYLVSLVLFNTKMTVYGFKGVMYWNYLSVYPPASTSVQHLRLQFGLPDSINDPRFGIGLSMPNPENSL